MCLSPDGRFNLKLIEAWEKARISDQKKNQITLLVDGQNFVFFFEYHNDIFGAPEASRVTFARMKNPDDESPQGWVQDANFMAVNLSKAIFGQPVQQIFKDSDIHEIHVINDKNKVSEMLAKQAETIAPENLVNKMKTVFLAMKPREPGIKLHQDKEQ